MSARRLSVAVLWLAVMQAGAQTTDWKVVGRIAPGERVTILKHDDRLAVDGRFGRWSDDSLEVLKGKSPITFAKADVRQVYVQQKASRWKGAMWGAIIGFAVLFPCGAANAGYITDQNSPRVSTRIAIGTGTGLFGAGIGAGLGALVGGSKNVKVYDVRESR